MRQRIDAMEGVCRCALAVFAVHAGLLRAEAKTGFPGRRQPAAEQILIERIFTGIIHRSRESAI